MKQLFLNKIFVCNVLILLFVNCYGQTRKNISDIYYKGMFDKEVVKEKKIDSVVIINRSYEYDFKEGIDGVHTIKYYFNKEGEAIRSISYSSDTPNEIKEVDFRKTGDFDMDFNTTFSDTSFYTHFYQDEQNDAELEGMSIRTETYKEFVKLTHYEQALPVVIYYLINMPWEIPFFKYDFAYYSGGKMVIVSESLKYSK